MNPAVQKTLSFLLLIAIGFLLKSKIKKKEQLGGIKVLILTIALPATIFIALLKINVATHLLFLPVLALAFNFIMLLSARTILPFFGVSANTDASRTLMMLFPSLAPGLSCFPFILEYFGEESIAYAALADVGNKIFGLILLYLLAMHWYYRVHNSTEIASSKNKVKDLAINLVKEPINLVIVVAIFLLCVGCNIQMLPEFLQQAISRMSSLMTPMILLYIGLAVKINWQQIKVIFSLLFVRAGIAFLFGALLVSLLPVSSPAALIVAVAFPLSSASFWPFAHMSAVSSLENTHQNPDGKRTFDTDLALAVLAFSLPLSTILILGVCASGTIMLQVPNLLIAGFSMITLAILPRIYRLLTASSSKSTKTETVSPTPKHHVSIDHASNGIEETVSANGHLNGR